MKRGSLSEFRHSFQIPQPQLPCFTGLDNISWMFDVHVDLNLEGFIDPHWIWPKCHPVLQSHLIVWILVLFANLSQDPIALQTRFHSRPQEGMDLLKGLHKVGELYFNDFYNLQSKEWRHMRPILLFLISYPLLPLLLRQLQLTFIFLLSEKKILR